MIVQTLVFPIILYVAETWTIKKADRKTIDAFELWLSGGNCSELPTQIGIQPKRKLESRIVKATLYFFGHVVRSEIIELQKML